MTDEKKMTPGEAAARASMEPTEPGDPRRRWDRIAQAAIEAHQGPPAELTDPDDLDRAWGVHVAALIRSELARRAEAKASLARLTPLPDVEEIVRLSTLSTGTDRLLLRAVAALIRSEFARRAREGHG